MNDNREVPENAMHSLLEKYKGCKILILYCGERFFYRIEDNRSDSEPLIVESTANAYLSQEDALKAARKNIEKILLRDRLIELCDAMMQSAPKARGALYLEFLDKLNLLTDFDAIEL